MSAFGKFTSDGCEGVALYYTTQKQCKSVCNEALGSAGHREREEHSWVEPPWSTAWRRRRLTGPGGRFRTGQCFLLSVMIITHFYE